jgi:hypothetical protein
MSDKDFEKIEDPREVDRVPRTQSEEALLLRTQPDGWEYLLFAAVLRRKRDELEPKWREHEARCRQPSEAMLGERETLDRMSGVFDEAAAIVDDMMLHFAPESQERAFGKLGESGDPQRITEFAEVIVAAYSELLDWSARLRASSVPERFRGIFDIAGEHADLPLRQFREYIDRVVDELDGLPAALREGRPITVVLTLTLSLDDEVQERFTRELDRVRDEVQRLYERAIESVEEQPSKGGSLMRMFGSHRAKKAAKQYEAEVAKWTTERDACAERLTLAKTYAGERSTAIMLKPDEAVFATITGASLVEDRRGPGQWQGRSSGVSIPIGSIGGRSIRYRTGSSRGHFVQGAPVPTPIDTGTLFVTNRRAVFQGLKQTRECRFDKLVAFQHAADGSTIFSVSNRQKPTNVHYGPELSGWFDFRLDLALAHYRNETPTLVAQLEADLAAVDASKPTSPVLMP